MFESPAYAAATGGAASSGASGFLMQVFPFLLIFIIFYFLLIRPQQKRVKQHQDMIGAVKRGDTVVTNGGLIGRVTRVDESEIEVELAANVRVRVMKGMLSEVRPTVGKPANDEQPSVKVDKSSARGGRSRRQPRQADGQVDLAKDPDSPSQAND